MLWGVRISNSDRSPFKPLFPLPKQRAQPAPSKEMGLLFRRDIEGPGGAGPVSTISGVGIQFRKPQVNLSKVWVVCRVYMKKFASLFPPPFVNQMLWLRFQFQWIWLRLTQRTNFMCSFVITKLALTNTSICCSLSPDDMFSSYWKHVSNNKSMVKWI